MNLKERLRGGARLQIAGRLGEAEHIHQEVLAEALRNADAVHLLGLIRGDQDRDEEAIRMVEEAIAINPRAAPFHHNVAGLYRRLSRLENAEASFRVAIELYPQYGEAYQGLAEMRKFAPGDPLFAQAEQQLAEPLLHEVRRYFNFALGKMYDDVADYPRAFMHYRCGNREARREFSRDAFSGLVKDSLYHFSRRFADANRAPGSSQQSVFVVGVPRSGTTLVEQILESHSAVYGAGERNEMKRIARRVRS